MFVCSIMAFAKDMTSSTAEMRFSLGPLPDVRASLGLKPPLMGCGPRVAQRPRYFMTASVREWTCSFS